MLVADRASHGGIVGWTGERCRYRLRVRQGECDRRGAEPWREPQGDGQDVSARSRSRHVDCEQQEPKYFARPAESLINGAPEEIRAPDPQIRSLVLYPAEPRARFRLGVWA